MPQRRFAEPVELGGIDRRAPRPLHIEPGQLGRARQATRMRRQDALLAPPHGFPPISLVIPAKAGIQSHRVRHSPWTPAFAGVTIDLTLRSLRRTARARSFLQESSDALGK